MYKRELAAEGALVSPY